MNSTRWFTGSVRLAAAVAFASIAGAALADPLVLKSQGSFIVGGQLKHTDATGGHFKEDDIEINQMYVQFQIPEGNAGHVPVVMVHGGGISGKEWETTPDGRMGWGEYFVRKHHAVYIPDQSSYARSGFDGTISNGVKSGAQPPSALPNIGMGGLRSTWAGARFGPAYPTAFPDEQFPTGAIDELLKEEVPDLTATLPTPDPTLANMAAVAVRAGGAVLMGHSQSGFFPEQAALTDPTGVKGVVTIEGECSATPQQITALAKIPTLVIFGDHLADVPIMSAFAVAGLHLCEQFVQHLNAEGGDATLIHLPDIGIHGNSHVMMMDKNNLQVADLILTWIDQHVDRKRGRKRET
ncbi:MAG: hypothetical protein ACREU6_00190 [Steroidobacteraceae bacterium]